MSAEFNPWGDSDHWGAAYTGRGFTYGDGEFEMGGPEADDELEFEDNPDPLFEGDDDDDDPKTLAYVFGDDDPEMGFIDTALKGIGRVAKSVVSSPITKVTATGVAMAFPAVGVPLAAGVVAADKLVTAARSKRPRVRRTARNVIKRTAKLAKTNRSGKRALKLIKAAAKARKKKRMAGKLKLSPSAKRKLAKLKRSRNPKARKLFAKIARRIKKRSKTTVSRKRKSKKRTVRDKKVKGFLVTTKGRILRGRFVKVS